MKDRIHETPIVNDSANAEVAFSDRDNFAILGLPPEYGDPDAIQRDAVTWIQNDEWLNAKDGNDLYTEDQPLAGLDVDASDAVSIPACEPLVRYYATLARSWGFSDAARLTANIQMDKTQNPNSTEHKDGIGSNSIIAAQEGKNVRAVRFVYPIGRPGTVLYPDMQHDGTPVDWKFDAIPNPTEEDELLLARHMTVDGEERQRMLDQAGAVQVLPGATLVFDMTKSPWHVAADRTPGAGVMTVNVFESW